MLYLVKWPDNSASVVSAYDEADLFQIVDQRANPYDTSWEQYDGPVWIEFPSPGEAVEDTGDVDPDHASFSTVRTGGSHDHVQEMFEAVRRAVSPTVETLRDGFMQEGEDEPIPRELFETAYRGDMILRLDCSFSGTVPRYYGLTETEDGSVISLESHRPTDPATP